MSEESGSCCGGEGSESPPIVESEESGSCCGGGGSESPPIAVPKKKAVRLTDYQPLIVLLVVTMLGATAKQFHYGHVWSTMSWMRDFMGFFLVVFAMFKLFDLSGFADGFQKYDLLASRFRPYALAYPFLELLLGLGYLSVWNPLIVCIATILLMGFGAIGVFSALKKGLNLNCACMGSTLNVPLTTVALTEDLVMAGMALVMLLWGA